jgi:predicted AlkP superfamily pyrophosphatase or phosphodiesterase
VVSHAASLASLVIIVSVDGLRPDAVAKAGTPFLDSLVKQGAHIWRAQTVLPSITLVSQTSMLTGVEPKRHGITTDTGAARTVQVPTCFELARRAGHPTCMVVGKSKLRRLAKPGTVDYFSNPGYWAKDIAREVVKRLAQQQTGLMFLHFPDPDSAGHKYGWMSPKQLKSVSDCDSALGTMLKALDGYGLRGRTLVIVTADHGGHDRVHGTKDARDRTIPWICAGPGVGAGREIRGPVSTCDTAATALHALGVAIPSDWQGKPVFEAFEPRRSVR